MFQGAELHSVATSAGVEPLRQAKLRNVLCAVRESRRGGKLK